MNTKNAKHLKVRNPIIKTGRWREDEEVGVGGGGGECGGGN